MSDFDLYEDILTAKDQSKDDQITPEEIEKLQKEVEDTRKKFKRLMEINCDLKAKCNKFESNLSTLINPVVQKLLVNFFLYVSSLRFSLELFNDYVDQILAFFHHHLPIVDKRGHFKYHLPFVHVDDSKIPPSLLYSIYFSQI